MKKWYLILILFTGLGLVLAGCGDKSSTSPEFESSAAVFGQGNNSGETAYTCHEDGDFVGYEGECPSVGVYEYTLWAGKHNDAGTVRIWTDDSYLYVEYDTNDTADLREAHVYVWLNEEDIPDRRHRDVLS